jgi:hypothetical protein
VLAVQPGLLLPLLLLQALLGLDLTLDACLNLQCSKDGRQGNSAVTSRMRGHKRHNQVSTCASLATASAGTSK